MSHPRTLTKRHTSCPDCGGILHRHGDRRWRCVRCRSTVRFHRRRPGPKRKRGAHLGRVGRYLRGRHTIRDLAYLCDQSYGTAHERLQRGLAVASALPVAPLQWWRGHCVILVADALWTHVGNERATVYIILLRGTESPHAYTTVALPLPGWESEAGWCRAFKRIPAEVLQEVIGATIDGHAGLHAAVQWACGEPDWRPVIQWCQFHCLAELLRKLGKRSVHSNPHARCCWMMARAVLDENRQPQRDIWAKLIILASRSADCPERTRLAMRWFLSVLPRVTALFSVPDSAVPATNGSAESLCKQLRAVLNKIRPSSWERLQSACDIFLRLHPRVGCLKWNCTPRFQRIFKKRRAESHQDY